MTRRAIILGLAASAACAAIGFYNDMVLKQTFLFSSYMPAFVYGLTIPFVLLVNPLLARLRPGLALTRGELATIIVLTFPACFVSGRTLVHHFPATIITPKHYNRTQLGWQRYDLLRRVPPIMLAGYSPELRPEDILDAPGLVDAVDRLLRAPSGPEEQALAEALRREGLGPADPSLTAERVRQALNRAMQRPDLFAGLPPSSDLPAEARRIAAKGFVRPDEHRWYNRLLVDAMFPGLLQSWQERDDAVVQSFQTGLGQGTIHLAPNRVPWGAWDRTLLLFWGPLLLVLCLAYIGFALVAQRQWAEHEHLPFPIVTFTESILPDPGSAANRSVFRHRGFWICAVVIALWHVNNYAVRWWPDTLIEIPRTFNLSPLRSLVPIPWDSWRLLDPIIYFTIVGLAYFVSSEASLSVGLAPFIYALVAGMLGSYGIILGGANWNSPRTTNYVMLGGYCGLFLMLLYSGRRHFGCVFKRAFGLRVGDLVHPHEKWGGRLFLVAAAGFVLVLRLGGVHLVWGLWYLLLLWIVYTVVARIVAETGMILIHPVLFPGILAAGFWGAQTLGLDQIVAIATVSTVIGVGCHVTMLPLMSQALRLSRGRESRIAAWCTVSLVVALVVAIPVTIYLQYDFGATANNDGWTHWLPYSGLEAAERIATKLDAQGMLHGGAPAAASLPATLGSMLGRASFIGFAIALLGVIVFEVIRLRWRAWPFHPIMFVVLDFWVSRQLAVSFLIGWAIKTGVCRYGGARLYQRLKPVMLGLIAGDMLGQLIISIACTLYGLHTGKPPKAYWVLPG